MKLIHDPASTQKTLSVDWDDNVVLALPDGSRVGIQLSKSLDHVELVCLPRLTSRVRMVHVNGADDICPILGQNPNTGEYVHKHAFASAVSVVMSHRKPPRRQQYNPHD